MRLFWTNRKHLLTIYAIFLIIVSAGSIRRFILARMGRLGGLSHVRAVMSCLSYRNPFKEILKKGERYVTEVVNFIIGILGRIISGLFTTYIVRLIDKLAHKNNRHE